jgi:hypothetical protein
MKGDIAKFVAQCDVCQRGETPEIQSITPAITHTLLEMGGHKYGFHQWTPEDPKG